MNAEELFNKYINFAYKIAGKYFNYPLEKEDIIQQALEGLWVASNKFDESKKISFMTFANTVINNNILIYLRKIKRHMGHTSLDKQFEERYCLADIIPSNEDYIFEVEEQIDIDSISKIFNIIKLEDKDAMVFKLLIQGKTQKEIACMINSSQGNVSRIKKKISQKLLKEYLGS